MHKYLHRYPASKKQPVYPITRERRFARLSAHAAHHLHVPRSRISLANQNASTLTLRSKINGAHAGASRQQGLPPDQQLPTRAPVDAHCRSHLLKRGPRLEPSQHTGTVGSLLGAEPPSVARQVKARTLSP